MQTGIFFGTEINDFGTEINDFGTQLLFAVFRQNRVLEDFGIFSVSNQEKGVKF